MYESETVRPGRDLRRAEAQAVSICGAMGTAKIDLPPKPSSFLAATIGEIEQAIKELVALNSRLVALADRVFGSPAETPGSSGPAAVCVCAADDIQQRIATLHTLVQRAHFTAARLESL